MYRLGLTAILGFQKVGNFLRIDPVIPPSWDRFEINYQFKTASFQIHVINPAHVGTHVQHVQLDGKILGDNAIPLVDDGLNHIVEVTMG
jgi:cyclic beta-1,2-glucan synthetase